MESFPQSIFAVPLILIVYTIYRQWTRISVADVPGPEPESFLLGCLPEMLQSQVAQADFKWQARFGHVVRVKGILGSDRLLISDPKAIQYIYNSGHNIRKQGFRSELTRVITGPGLAWANNEIHRRQRKVNSAAFGTNEARSYVPIFVAYASVKGKLITTPSSHHRHWDQLSTQWKELLAIDMSAVVNTPRWFSRFFLDVIGEVAFDYQFSATDDEDDPFAIALSSVAPGLTIPSKLAIFILALVEFLPPKMIHLFMEYAPVKALQNSRRVTRIAVGVAKDLVDEKAEALIAGKGKRDIMSLLVKANASANLRMNLSETEMLAQMQTIMQAGHETTANTLSWTMFELTQHPDVQSKLRAEIRVAESAMHARGATEFTYVDFEAMPYTVAVMKETLRFHPVAYSSVREAARDEVLPLSTPIVTKSGKTITELPIPKDMILVISNAGYNRLDAQVFNPERWLNGTVQTTTSVGVYGNLMTFGSGHRACIGWRIAVYEYQAFLVELRKVTLVAQFMGSTATVAAPDGEEVTVTLLPDTHMAPDAYYEVIGSVVNPTTIKMYQCIDMGTNLDMKLVDDTIKLMHDQRFYAKMFSPGD
ncbi:cytochrome P450 [Mycena rosella]|uniref:Cytochrome P450 n=1 Tax=Mycena rosella TaxID=1033263 RepID=A0AAD7DH74_MYCRO|nr:cytochrome P450 [Mycena rosella]